ncbi:Plasmid stabilization system protein [Rubripirellula obstinata]|uniref:Plasmid stabilization system protein n=1 Tax=Rubripirellula obstinata TaxID=406547 RepID=A0A5B1C8F3_9BACT|nr:type II toxin-antitoxin system RelE/ParE family toxin [Rubripirellula obstinata]KAA1257377.1 Plasmid stabilization system protein [Rubripirellula obstinata]
MTTERRPYWRPIAWQDIEGHAVYVGQGDPSAGQRFIDCVEETVENLCVHPELGAIYESAELRLGDIRATLVSDFKRHAVFYRVEDRMIDVVRVLGRGQNMDMLLRNE